MFPNKGGELVKLVYKMIGEMIGGGLIGASCSNHGPLLNASSNIFIVVKKIIVCIRWLEEDQNLFNGMDN